MARFIIENSLNEPEALRDFRADGYRYNRKESGPREPVFTREAAPS